MLLLGLGWTSAFATIQAAAQLVCPPWVRARSLSIYQLAQNGALTVGSFVGLAGPVAMSASSATLLTAAVVGLLLMFVVRGFSVEEIVRAIFVPATPPSHRAPRKRRRRSSCRCCGGSRADHGDDVLSGGTGARGEFLK